MTKQQKELLAKPEKQECPECLGQVDQQELDTFGGLCEECCGAFDGGMFEEEQEPEFE